MAVRVTNSADNAILVSSDLGITGGSLLFGTWIRFTAQPGADNSSQVIGQSDAGSGVSYLLRYEDSAGTKRLAMVRNRNGVAATSILYNTTLTLNQWYHLVGAYDGTDLFIFVDGNQVQTGTGSSGTGNAGLTDRFTVGQNADLAVGSIDALFAHVFCYDARITNARVRNLFTRKPGNDPNLQCYLPLQEGAGTTVYDHAIGFGLTNGSITTAIWSNLHPTSTYK